MEVPGQKPRNGRTKFLDLLILEHLKNYFIEALNTFLMWFEINGFKNLKLTILRFFAKNPLFTHTTLIAIKTFLLLRHHGFT